MIQSLLVKMTTSALGATRSVGKRTNLSESSLPQSLVFEERTPLAIFSVPTEDKSVRCGVCSTSSESLFSVKKLLEEQGGDPVVATEPSSASLEAAVMAPRESRFELTDRV